MSHYTVLVIGPDAAGQLEPYDENREMAPYKVKCECVKWRAMSWATAKTVKKYGSVDALRAKFHAKPESERSDGAWEKHIKPFMSMRDKLTKDYRKRHKPLKSCEECSGTGRRTTTYNPHSKWDWFEIGGRWRDYLTLKDGTKADEATWGEVAPDIIPTFAVLKDGHWYEKGHMGWWACVSEEKAAKKWDAEFRSLLKGLKDDTELVLVDCHI